jgi:hypothetical protein
MFRAIPKIQETPIIIPAAPLPRPPSRPALNIRDSTIFEADLSNSLMDLQNGARQEENDYEAFNPPPKPRSAMRVHFNPETPQTLLKKHQAEADAAYRKNDISFV